MSENREDFIIAIRSALLKKGTKQKFSLFFLIIISITFFVLDNLSYKFTKVTRSILNDGIYIVSSAASFGFVAPINSLFPNTAFSFSSTITTIGPDDKYAHKSL